MSLLSSIIVGEKKYQKVEKNLLSRPIGDGMTLTRKQIEAVYLEMLALAKGGILEGIGKRHHASLGSMYKYQKRFQGQAEVISGIVSKDRRKAKKEEEEGAASDRTEEEEARESNTASTESPDDTPAAPTKGFWGRQKNGCRSLPIVARMLGKSVRNMRRIIRDNGIKPDCTLVKRCNGDVPGYSEETIEKIRRRESKDVDSVELRKILNMSSNKYMRFLKDAALFMNDTLFAAKFSKINYVLQQHKKGCTYRFDRNSISDLKNLKEYIEECDGRKKENKGMKKHLESLKNDQNKKLKKSASAKSASAKSARGIKNMQKKRLKSPNVHK